MIRNYYSFWSFILCLALLCIHLGFFIPKQFKEVMRPKNGFTRLRRRIFITLLIGAIAIGLRTNSLYHSMHRPISPNFDRVGSIATNVILATYTISWWSILTYKERD